MRTRRAALLSPLPSPLRCTFVPPYLLRNLADSGSPVAQATLVADEGLRLGREVQSVRPPAAVAGAWAVHTADNSTTLPGRLVRSEGDPASGDVAVDEAAYGITQTLLTFSEVLGRPQAGVSLSVHYGRDYANAFWDGTQLVFGDGDREIFDRFTKPIDVLAHEFGHAVVENEAAFAYRDQSGALNESVADVFAACLKQHVLGQSADEGDWLIGEGLFLPGVRARALRDMSAPGTAYDDPRLGKDPQVGHMDDYVETSEDNGGVHLNSGIPNRAFHVAATAIGGDTLSGAGQIWLTALASPELGPDSDFVAFAAATVAAAGEHVEAVEGAWAAVGLGSTASGSGGAPAPAASTVRVSRSGGFAGITEHFEVDLDSSDPALAPVRRALAQVEAEQSLAGQGELSAPQPDRFAYTFRVGKGAPLRVAEQDLTDSLRGLADAVRECKRSGG